MKLSVEKKNSYTRRIQVCPKEGLPLHSYSFRMGLEPSILFDREGSGFLGISRVGYNSTDFKVKYITPVKARQFLAVF